MTSLPIMKRSLVNRLGIGCMALIPFVVTWGLSYGSVFIYFRYFQRASLGMTLFLTSIVGTFISGIASPVVAMVLKKCKYGKD